MATLGGNLTAEPGSFNDPRNHGPLTPPLTPGHSVNGFSKSLHVHVNGHAHNGESSSINSDGHSDVQEPLTPTRVANGIEDILDDPFQRNGLGLTNDPDGMNGTNGIHDEHEHEIGPNDCIDAHPPKRHKSHPITPPSGLGGDAGGPASRGRAHIRSYAEDEHVQAFPRISRPVELMRGSYDCVVIGSGYGGGIAASRMARAGRSVCLLELGRERWPGEYPVNTIDSLKELHVSGELTPGNLPGKGMEGGDPTGMFHLVFGQGQSAVVCNGLGGTSLMNANVFMEADEKVLEMPIWPPEIRDHVKEFNEYYKKVEKVLDPQEYPDDWPKLPKLELLKKQAAALGCAQKFRKVRQTTRFRNGPNSAGVEMSASALTGQDCTGVNDGSKNTTLVTYLADAWNWGAEMFCECEVRYIEKCTDREGYLIYFAWHGRNRGAFKANLHGDLMWVHARNAVFLGAGAIGSTEILLRSKAMGLEMSDQVGQNISGNGDILAFGYNTDEEANAIGRAYPSPYKPIGPTINGVIDCRQGHENPLDGFVIEEGAVPHALAGLLQAILELLPGSITSKDEGIAGRTQAAFARYGSRFLGPYFKKGAIEKTQVYLIMSHDCNQAVLSLKNDKPVLEFIGVGRSDHVKYLNGVLAQATEAVGGTLIQSPWYALLGQQEVTVHPIGGASMARDNTGKTGVVNHRGEVFTGQGSNVHKGLIVTDGAVVAAALGANPFATISALAERAVELYAEEECLHISEEENGVLDLFGEPKHRPEFHHRPNPRPSIHLQSTLRDRKKVAFHAESIDKNEDLIETASVNSANEMIHHAEAAEASGFGFTEVMSGFIHHDLKMRDDKRSIYEQSYRIAKANCESARFFLSVQAYDTKLTVSNADHRAMLTGTFVCPTLPGSPFMVQRGEFNLFIVDTKATGTRNLTYDFDMTGTDGQRLHFHGYKVVNSSVALAPVQFWRATSTLYVTISEHDPEVLVTGANGQPEDREAWRRLKVLAKGVMHIAPADFLSEVLTLTPTGAGIIRKIASATSFLTFFTRKSMALFFAPLTALQYPSQTYSGYVNPTPPQESVAIVAADGVTTRLHVWEPTHVPRNDKVRNLFMVPGASVDHQIYALPTIPFNAVNYFTRAGYRVHIAVHRIGQLMVAENNWTTFDARLDLKACLEWIRAKHGPDPVYTISHCMGSVAFSSGLLDGTIPASWILGISASQVFMNPIWQTLNLIKAQAGPVPLDRLYRLAAGGGWFSCSTSPDDSLIQRGINQLLRLYPSSRRELCNSAACHRVSLVFGRCWSHDNLNEATHRQIDRFFGGVNMTCLHLLMRMGSHGAVMRNAPLCTSLTTPENVRRLAGIPFFLWAGSENAVLSTEATQRTYETLTDAFGGGGTTYRRRIIPGYGHLDGWMGRNAWRDVYPVVLAEMDRVVRGERYVFEEPRDKWARMVRDGVLC